MKFNIYLVLQRKPRPLGRGGKHIEHEDIPAGVEEGDYFTREKVNPKDLKVVK